MYFLRGTCRYVTSTWQRIYVRISREKKTLDSVEVVYRKFHNTRRLFRKQRETIYKLPYSTVS